MESRNGRRRFGMILGIHGYESRVRYLLLSVIVEFRKHGYLGEMDVGYSVGHMDLFVEPIVEEVWKILVSFRWTMR